MKLEHNINRLRKRAAQDVAKKIMLEPHLAKDMRRILKHILKGFLSAYPHSISDLSPDKYHSEVTTALRNHYRKVVKKFSASIRDEISLIKLKANDINKVEDSVNLKMNSYLLSHSDKQASIIIRTTQKELHNELHKVIADSINKGEKPDHRKISSIVAKDYLKKIRSRAQLISVTETQSMAEKTKDVELNEINDLDELDDSDSMNFARTWVAILDDHTREWHAEADGQIAEANESFNVGGETLDYPGDPTGSPENIINCRCSAIAISS